MSTSNKKEKDKIVVIIILAAILVCSIGFFIYHKWSVRQKELEFEKMREQETIATEQPATEAVAEEETETEEVDDTVYCDPVYDFDELHAQNEDIYAWIEIPGTKVDYPVLQSETDNYYLNRNVDNSTGYPGCIYTNACNQKDFSDYITVLYGHNMKNKTMFGSLHSFEDEDFFNENDKIYVYIEDRRLTYEIKEAVKYTNAYIQVEYALDTLEDRDLFLEDLSQYLDSSVAHEREDVTIDDDSKLIVLSTCVAGQSDHRYLIVGVLEEEAFYKQAEE